MRVLGLLLLMLVVLFSYGIYTTWDNCLTQNASDPFAHTVCWDRIKAGKL